MHAPGAPGRPFSQVLAAVLGALERGSPKPVLRLLDLLPRTVALLLAQEAPEGERGPGGVGVEGRA